MPTLLSTLMPFEEALRTLAARGALPTDLDSAALRQLGGGFHRQNLVSARTMLSGYMDEVKDAIESVINPTTEQRADRVTAANPQGNVTTGYSTADARMKLAEELRKRGYTPAPAEKGSITDLSSRRRIDLVIKTNMQLHQGAGFAVQSNDAAVREAFPCWELYRLESKKRERDWPVRWQLAAQTSGDTDALRVFEQTGRMVARKDSPIWQALGDGAGGYEDTLGNAYPPFAFNSGMWVRNVAYADAEELGLVTLATKVESSLPDDLAQLFEEAA